MTQDLNIAPEVPQHTYRLSINLTRRIVRRMIELDLADEAQIWKPTVRVSNVPDTASFQFSLRVLRRVMHRLMEQTALHA